MVEVYFREPKNFNPSVEAASTFVFHKEYCLWLLRQDTKFQGNKWCPPGGKLENGELPVEAAVRELWEETGITVGEYDLCDLSTAYVRLNKNYEFVYYQFGIKVPFPYNPIINPREHKDFAWMTLEEAVKKPLFAGEIECINNL